MCQHILQNVFIWCYTAYIASSSHQVPLENSPVGIPNVTIDTALTHEFFLRICNRYLRNIVIEYCQLSVLDVLTDDQTLKIDSILKDAETDPLLSFLLDEADHVIGHLTDLVDVKEIQSEQAELKQLIDETWKNWLLDKVQNGDLSLLSPHVLKQAQTQLKEHGLYTADVDGVYGEKTKEAVQRLGKDSNLSIKVSTVYSETETEDCSAKTNTESINRPDVAEGILRSAEILSWLIDESVTLPDH